MTDMYYYNISDFDNIKWASTNNPITLPEETIKLINTITDQVSAPSYVKTPNFGNNDKSKFKKKKRENEIVRPEDWELIRNFQKTEITKKEGIDKELDNIRSLINKLTEKTYDKILEKIHGILEDITNNDDYNLEANNKMGYAIFNMATSNKFNSNVYAKFCCDLKSKYSFITTIVNNNIDEFMKIFENMVFVDPDENYDKFCEMNIVNEKRRSMSLFLTNLYKYDVVPLQLIMDNIINIQNMIIHKDLLSNVDKRNEGEELAENLFIMLTNIDKLTLKSTPEWKHIYDNIILVKTIDTVLNPGISHKCKFKHMDIYDKVE
jgi:hypothetical protein